MSADLSSSNSVQSVLDTSIYSFKVNAIDGGIIDLSHYKGKYMLLVNTATSCGLAGQFAELQALYEQYQDKLIIIGFPSNDFFFQELRGNEAIQSHCKLRYGVSFPLSAKLHVKGSQQAPIYQWLTQKKLNSWQDSTIKWNFQKYLISPEGKLLQMFGPRTLPSHPDIAALIV